MKTGPAVALPALIVLGIAVAVTVAVPVNRTMAMSWD